MRKALAIDLDGTLLSTNTFRDYLSYCGSAALHNFQFDICFSILWWVVLRKLRFVSHSRMKQALLDGDMDYLRGEAIAQTEAGADILDVNVGTPGIDEAAVLPMAVQAICTLAQTRSIEKSRIFVSSISFISVVCCSSNVLNLFSVFFKHPEEAMVFPGVSLVYSLPAGSQAALCQ